MKKITYLLIVILISFCSSGGDSSTVGGVIDPPQNDDPGPPQNTVPVSPESTDPGPPENNDPGTPQNDTAESSDIDPFVIDAFIICIQNDNLDFYSDGFDSNGMPLFIYYAKEGEDSLMTLNESCYSEFDNLAIEMGKVGVQPSTFLEYVVKVLYPDFGVSNDNDPFSQSGTLTTTEECTEYGCIKVTTGLDTWLDGTVEKGLGISYSQYQLWKNDEVKNDFVQFDLLEPLQKTARWAAQSTVVVIGDRCFDQSFPEKLNSGELYSTDGIHLTTDPISGFFISDNYIMTQSIAGYTLEDQRIENEEIIQNTSAEELLRAPVLYGSMETNFASFLHSCDEKESVFNADPVNSDYGVNIDLIHGEGPIVQLFDGTYGAGKIVYSDGCKTPGYACLGVSVIKLEKYTNNPYLPVEEWEDWSSKSEEILPLPLRSMTTFEDKEVVYIHHPWEGNDIGGWFTTVSNAGNCSGNLNIQNNSIQEDFYLDSYADEGSGGAPVMDDEGFVIGMINSPVQASSNNCGEVARSNSRNNLGVLSSFLYDGLDVTSVFNARRLTSVVESVKNIESLMSTPISPEIKEIYKWPLNPLTPSKAKFETYDYGDSFTESGFPVSELESPAFEIAKQATLIFVRQTGCSTCDEDAKDENFAITCACTAFAVSENLIVTNNHCVPNMELGDKATFKTYAGQNLEATLIGKSSIDGNPEVSDLYKEVFGENMGGGDPFERGDVALFRSTDKMDLTPVVIADSKSLKQFDPIISVGHPAKMSRSGPFVVTAGSIVGIDWTLAGTKVHMLIPASKGASGSGVFNLKGELVAQVCCGGGGSNGQQSSIAYSKYGLVATAVDGGFPNPAEALTRGINHPPRKYKFSKYVEIGAAKTTDGAPSNYIKELIELWAPGELGY